jgi:hypothetical protein
MYALLREKFGSLVPLLLPTKLGIPVPIADGPKGRHCARCSQAPEHERERAAANHV